ncbi:MAG: DUF1800 domain-containing protein [Chloroflexi bacterium]|nr:DUF1800 domain-containing protein [Chloroflexota bacterium]
MRIFRQVDERPGPKARKERRLAPVDRRAVLGAALAGGAGVAAARLLGIRRVVEVEPEQLTKQAVATRSGLDWVSPLGDEAVRVAHLLRRTSFGYSPAELEAALTDGYQRAVDRLIETPPMEPPTFPAAENASQTNGLNAGQLQQWWLDWAIKSPTPFAEVMTLFWHGHFTSDYRKVGLQSPYLYWQDLTWRRFFLRDLRSILYEVTVDPAMLRYLDLSQSTGQNPNENYARELMELYTMGSGAFAEDDVKAASRGLAGWREPRTQAMVDAQIEQSIKQNGAPPKVLPTADKVKVGIFERNRAYNGPDLTFLGERRRWDTNAILDRVVEQDVVAPFITRKVLSHFVSPDVEDATVARLADRFRRSRHDMRTLMHDVLTSPEFTSPKAYRSLVRSPLDFMIATAKALNNPELARTMPQQGDAMGQVMFDPPSVGGWPTNASWISSNTMLARINFATQAVNMTRKVPASGDAHAQYLDSTLSPQTLELLNAVNDDRRRWMVVLCCAEFQLK